MCSTSCVTYFSSAGLIRELFDTNFLGGFIVLDTDEVVDVLVRLRAEKLDGPRAVFWSHEARLFEAALTMTELEDVRGVSERAQAAGVQFQGKTLEEYVLKKLIRK